MPAIFEAIDKDMPLGCLFAKQAPPCSDWLSGQSDAGLDHVCWHVAARSVHDFLAHWGLARGDMPAYVSSWPVPVGENALPVWYSQRAPLELFEGSFVERLYRWLGPSLAMKSDFYIDIPRIRLHPVLTSIVTDPDAWLFAVARRQTEAGTAWLLGTARLEQSHVSWPYIGTEGVKFTTSYYTWDGDGECIEAKSVNGEIASVRYTWKFALPYIMTVSVGGGGEDARVFAGEGNRAKWGSLKDLHTESERLARDWSRMLGMTIGGRPPGSKEYWCDREDFLTTVRAAIKTIEQDGPATQEKVAEYLSSQRTRVSRPHATGDYSERQFRRDREDFGFSTWAELKKTCQD